MNGGQSVVNRLREAYGRAIEVGEGCEIASDLSVEMNPTGRLIIQDGTLIRRGCTISVGPGAIVSIGRNVTIGDNVFIAAMVGIVVGDGVGISNMVDLHDHNHRERSMRNLEFAEGDSSTPWASGFQSAPIILEPGCVLSNKVTVTAGCRVGENSIVGANSVVSRSCPPNCVVVGAPARPIKAFEGPILGNPWGPVVRGTWFGTSLTSHLEAHSDALTNPAQIPAVGDHVEITQWRSRGFAHLVATEIQADWPHVTFSFTNRGVGGATSRDLLQIVDDAIGEVSDSEGLVFLECGTNDVWRGLQGRAQEFVDLAEFEINIHEVLSRLAASYRVVICIGPPPFGPDSQGVDSKFGNRRLSQYRACLAAAAKDHHALYIDATSGFTETVLCHATARSPWIDGVHLNDYGDTLVARSILAEMRAQRVVETMLDAELVDPDIARDRYRAMLENLSDNLFDQSYGVD